MAEANRRPIKIIAGADAFGCALKDSLVEHLRSISIDVEDLGSDKYYSIGEEIGRRVSLASSEADGPEIRGLVACGTGVGVSIFANKFPGVYAATCESIEEAVNTRSINNCNVLAVGGMKTPPETGVEILDAWLQTPFNSSCPASGGAPWPADISEFLDESLSEMSQIPNKQQLGTCSICSHSKIRDFTPVEIMPGGSMKIVRENPTSAFVKFKEGSVEPAHHHTFGHDLVVMKGKKKVWNLSKNESYELSDGDFLFTPAGDVHRVKYFEDTEFFIRWDAGWDIFLDEDLETAIVATSEERSSGSSSSIS